MKEGYVKFRSFLHQNSPPSDRELKDMYRWREVLYRLKYIGAYHNGVGYGNISIRCQLGREFIISGTGTGGTPVLQSKHFVRVTDYDLKKNQVVCLGMMHASSESMTHAALYDCDVSIGAIIHIYSKKFWDMLKNQLPLSDPSAAYGTLEMAREMVRLYRHTAFKRIGVMIMGGHEEGIFSFGSTLHEAGERLLSVLKED